MSMKHMRLVVDKIDNKPIEPTCIDVVIRGNGEGYAKVVKTLRRLLDSELGWAGNWAGPGYGADVSVVHIAHV